LFKEKSIHLYHISPDDYIVYIIVWYIVKYKGTTQARWCSDNVGHRVMWKCYVR